MKQERRVALSKKADEAFEKIKEDTIRKVLDESQNKKVE